MKTWEYMDKQIMDVSVSDQQPISPSYDFHPIHSLIDSVSVTPSIAIPAIINYNSLDSIEPAKGVTEKDYNASNSVLLFEIDRTMKKHADKLMHALEGVSARITQLESRSRNLENSMDDLKVALGNNQGSTDSKLRQLENILREVQSSVQTIRDKQDIFEGQLLVAKLQVSKAEPESHVQANSFPQTASAPLPIRLANQYLPNHVSCPPAPLQYYQPPPSQQHPSITSMNPAHHLEDPPYAPPPSLHQSVPFPNVTHPSSQQLYGPPLHLYDSSSGRSGSGYSLTYGISSGLNETSPYPYSRPVSQFGGGGTKQQISSSQLPTARVLPQALPTASRVGDGSGGGSGTGNRVPIDDVVDKVTNMGFTRDQVRATVKKLTENGQSVDLNIVLDKLMNDGVEGQPPRGWFSR